MREKRQISPRQVMSCRVVLACAVAVFSCTADGTDGDAVLFDAQDAQDDTELLAVIRVGQDSSIEYRQTANGQLIVAEYGPITDPSALTYFFSVHDASPLEMFLATAPADISVPPALVTHHNEMQGLSGEPREPRALSLPDDSSDTFRGHFVWPPQYYAANCSFASDKAWWDDQVASTGWPWKWYWYGNNPGPPYPAGKATPTTTRNAFFSHVCNYSVPLVDGFYGAAHFVSIDEPHHLWTKVSIPPGYRSSVLVSSSSPSEYFAVGAWQNPSGNLKLGAIAN